VQKGVVDINATWLGIEPEWRRCHYRPGFALAPMEPGKTTQGSPGIRKPLGLRRV